MNEAFQQDRLSTDPTGSGGLTFQGEEQKRHVNSAWQLLKTISEIAVASSAAGVAPTMTSSNQLQYVYMMIQNNFLETHKALHERINLMTDEEGSIAVNEFNHPSHGHSSLLVQDSKGLLIPHSPPVSFSQISSNMEDEPSSSTGLLINSSNPSAIGATSEDSVVNMDIRADTEGATAGLTTEPRSLDGGVTKVTSLLLPSLKRSGEPHLSSRDENEGLTDKDGNSSSPKIRQSRIKQIRNLDGSHRLVGLLNPSSPSKTDSSEAYYLTLERNMWHTLRAASTAAIALQLTVTDKGLYSLTIKAINTFTNTFLLPALRNVNMFFGPRNSSLWRTPMKFNSRRGVVPTSAGISSQLSALHSSSTLASQGEYTIDLSTDVDDNNETVQVSKVHDVYGMDKIVPRQVRKDAHSLPLNAVAFSDNEISTLASCLFPISQRTALLQLCIGGPRGIAGKVDKETVTWEKLQCLVDKMWIKDEVINFFARSVSLAIHTVGVWVTLSTFYWSLAGHGKPPDYSFANAKKLTNKENINITTLKTVIIPLFVTPNHWAVIVINLEQKSIHYFDSLNAPEDTINVALGDVYVPQTNVAGPLRQYGPALRNCARWVFDEFQSKDSAYAKDVREWKGIVHSRHDVPQQNNGYDCGVFCMHMVQTFAEGKGPCFQMGGVIDAPNIPLMRRLIALSIVYSSPIPDADAAAPASAPSFSDSSLPQTQVIT